MSIERKGSVFAHNVGHTDVCYTLDGSKIITCGTDGDIRMSSFFEDSEMVPACVGEWALCVRAKGPNIYVATDNNDVQTVTLEDAERQTVLIRFTAPATHMAVGKQHNMIAVVSEAKDVKVIDTTDWNNCYNFSGLSGPALSVALSIDAKLLAVSSGDGFLRIWQVGTQEILKQIDGLPKYNSFENAKLLSRMDFHPTSDLAYPSNKSIVVLNSIDWSEKYVLSCSSVDAKFSIVQYSPCGKYLAAAAENGCIVVWNTSTQTLVGFSEHPNSITVCAMVWNPTGNGEILYCDVQGELGMIIIKNDNNETKNISVINELDINIPTRDKIVEEESLHSDLHSLTQESADNNIIADEDDDDDGENVISLEKLKRETLGLEEDESEARSVTRSPTPRPRTPITPMQPPFMPTSTPEHLNPRYLCWNEVGIIRSYGNPDDDSGELCSIEVEFHDTTFHNSMMMQNYQNYTMGSLSTAALAVANNSQISVIPLNASTKEWILTVPTGEEIVCIAASSNLICLATSAYFVRICSVFGIQRAVFTVPGPVIAISAQNYNILVAYHAAAPRNKDQSVDVILVTIEGMSMNKKQIGSALRPEATLSWLGFSDLSTPGMCDSSGILSLYPLQNNIWIPFCDTMKNASPADGFFITAIDEKLQSIRGIRCKGAHYPTFIPRPVLSELPLQPVFAELTTERTQLEANLFIWSTLQIDGVDRKFKETALKAFALACKSSLDDRAIELLEMLRNPQLLNLCVKYAAKQNRRLAEKLMEISPLINGGGLNEIDTTPDVSHQAKPTNKRLVLSSVKRKKLETSQNNTIEIAEESTLSSETNSTNIEINTQESTFTDSPPVNPFLKKSKTDDSSNPLNLTDKYAGYEEFQKKTKENDNVNEKRKLNDSEGEKQKGKQRKLDKFMFSKNS